MPIKVKFVQIYGFSLLNIRLVWYSLAFAHLVVTAVVTLTIDVTVDEDPLVRAYSRVRWKLITFWFNVITMAYLPLCLYCDWCETRDEEPPHVEPLRVLRDVVMTSILVPTTTFADVAFWMLFSFKPSLIAPPRVFEYLPYWSQHSLHTISLVTVIVDLILTPRRRPRSMKRGLVYLMGFSSAYCAMIHINLLQGEAVYTFLETASNTFLLIVYTSIHVLLSICYYAQWHLIDYVWGHKYKTVKKNALNKKAGAYLR